VSAPWIHGDPLAVARAILREPRFRHATDAPAQPTWWDRLLSWLGWLWDRLVASMQHLRGGGRVADVIGTLVLVAVVCALGVIAVRSVRRTARPAPSRDAFAADALDDALDAAALRARAKDAAAAGRFRDAAALLWTSALRALDERERVPYDAARTPGEWRRAVRDADFDVLARDAVAALFAGAADAALVARMSEAYDRMLPA
jgi:hypothetical protein